VNVLKAVRVSEEVYEKLRRIMEEKRLSRFSETVGHIVEEFEKLSMRNAQSCRNALILLALMVARCVWNIGILLSLSRTEVSNSAYLYGG